MRGVGVLVVLAAACNLGALPLGGGTATGPTGPTAPTGATGPMSSPPTSTMPGATPGPDGTCLVDGSCKASWTQVGVTPVDLEFYPQFVAALGRRIYFADASNNSQAAPAYVKSFGVDDHQFRDEPATPDLAAAGYGSTLSGAAGRLFYFGNQGIGLRPGDASWSSVSMPDPSVVGDMAVASDGSTLWFAGGRKTLRGFVSYDATNSQWNTSGLPTLPDNRYQVCAGAVGGSVYLFGGADDFNGSDPSVVLKWDAADGWSHLAVAFEGTCYEQTAATWSGLLAAFSAPDLALFDPSTETWSYPLQVPKLDSIYAVVAPEDGNLYVVEAETPMASHVSVYQLTLQ
jgi:hypothetical protein